MTDDSFSADGQIIHQHKDCFRKTAQYLEERWIRSSQQTEAQSKVESHALHAVSLEIVVEMWH